MCAIAGIVGPDSGAAEVSSIIASLAHRGPEAQRVRSLGAATLAAAELGFVTERPHQPLLSADGSCMAVLNGQIYDWRQERIRLGRSGAVFRTESDTEVALAVYQQRGVAGVMSLAGMYALAIYDHRRRRLLLARDRMGKKPLYWFALSATVVFASELRGVLAHPGAPADADREALASLLVVNTIPSPRTAIRGVHKLRPGSVLQFQWGEASQPFVQAEHNWWLDRGDVELETSEVRRGSRSAARRLVRGAIEDAVRRRVESTDVELGALVSGGVDSSLVAAIAAQHGHRPLQVFSIGFDDPSYDETPHAAALAAHIGATHHVERLDRAALAAIAMNDLPRVDEPLADPSLLPTLALMRAARSRVKGALSGDGGDELFWGYPFFRAARIMEWLPSARRAWLGATLRRLADRLPAGERNMHPGLIARLLARGIDSPPEERFYRCTGGAVPESLSGWLSPDAPAFAQGEALFDELHRFADAMERRSSPSGAGDSLERCRSAMLRFYLQDCILTKVDRAAGLAGFEVRSPLLDHRVADLALQLPWRWCLRGGQTKAMLREVAADWLPRSLARRRKQGFRAPIAALLRAELRPAAEELFSPPALDELGLVRPDVVRVWWREHLAGRRDNQKLLWPLLCLQVWRRAWRPDQRVTGDAGTRSARFLEVSA
jgi:asparagine synthase (glutamine-hydrolysing)